MKSTEFRLGNSYIYHVNGELDKVSKIDFDDIMFLIENPDNDSYQPIILTDECLIECGFERFDNVNNTPTWVWVKDNEPWFIQSWKHKNIRITIFNISGYKEIEFLHQLENLYYLVKGKELESNK